MLLYEVALKEAQEALGEYIDTCTTAELSPNSHVQNLIACYCGFPSYVSQHYVTRAKENGEGRQAHIEHTVARTGVHSIHGSRCRKGNAGETQSRNAIRNRVVENFVQGFSNSTERLLKPLCRLNTLRVLAPLTALHRL